MNVTEAVASRRSIRAFLDTPVSDTLLRELLEKSARAPSGGNVQPWQVQVLNGSRMQDFQQHLAQQNPREEPAYEIYPKDLPSPYRDSRFKVGEDMYGLLGIPREDKAGRFKHLARNFEFFGAPAAFFCLIDKTMGQPQWSDWACSCRPCAVGTRSGHRHLRARSVGHPPAGRNILFSTPDNLMLFCGMAIGQRDPDAPVNQLVADRMPLDSWAKWA